MRYFFKISYDGSKFYGFQRLNDNKTIQKVLEDALTKVDQSPVLIKGAGRTDRGVHANGQVVHFDLKHDIPEDGLKSIVNKLVGPYINIKECKKVSDDFHARFSVKQKTYRYRIYLGEYDPQIYDYAFELCQTIDIDKMKEASQYFLGVHDFRMFVSGERLNYMSLIYDISFKQTDEYLDIIFVGKSFYRYMIRNMVGALLDICFGKREIEEIKFALDGDSKIKQFSTAISNGLYLDSIEY